MLPILNVVAIQERGLFWRRLLNRFGITDVPGWLDRLFLGYRVLLSDGHSIHFTEEEKTEYDEAMNLHAETLKIYGMCRGLGLRT